MPTFRIDDMTCGHCARAITQAVHAVDAQAGVEVDLARHLVRVEPTQADAEALHAALTAAGYTPVAVQAQREPATAGAGGCCCGRGGSSCRA